MNNERDPGTISIPLGTQAANITLPGVYCRKHSRIKNAWLVDQAGLPVSGVNYVGVRLKDLAANIYCLGDTQLGSPALTPTLIPLSEDDSDSVAPISEERDVPALTMLNVELTMHGTGSLTDAILVLEFYNL